MVQASFPKFQIDLQQDFLFIKFDRKLDLKKCLEGLVKLGMTSYRLGELSGGFGESSYDHL